MKIGQAARPAVGRMLAAYPAMGYVGRWEVCHALAAAQPAPPDIPGLLRLMKEDECGMVQDLAVVLDRIGPASVPALVACWQTRVRTAIPAGERPWPWR